MATHSVFEHRNTSILSVSYVEAPEVVLSSQFDEALAETFERVGVRSGLLENVAGISERRWWPEDVSYIDAASMAGSKAIAEAEINPDDIGLLIDTSVCRADLEPSAAVRVHHQLGLSEGCLNFDLANACLGFVNAMHLAAGMIDAGTIQYALIVDGEGARQPQEATIARLQGEDTTADDVFAEFATLTLGSGGAAMVLGASDANPEGHRFLGGVFKAASEVHDLCVGTLSRMRTDTSALLEAGLKLAEAVWSDVVEEFDWLNMDRYILHQVSAVHTTMLCERLGIDISRAPMTFPVLGNIGPASVPITLAREVGNLEAGERVLCLGIGSGLNTAACEILW